MRQKLTEKIIALSNTRPMTLLVLGGLVLLICSGWPDGSSSMRRRPRRPSGSGGFGSACSRIGGRRAGVHATPTFFVDGERLDGPWRQLANIVPAKLKKASL
jgi:hypothetical protein